MKGVIARNMNTSSLVKRRSEELKIYKALVALSFKSFRYHVIFFRKSEAELAKLIKRKRAIVTMVFIILLLVLALLSIPHPSYANEMNIVLLTASITMIILGALQIIVITRVVANFSKQLNEMKTQKGMLLKPINE